MGIDSLLSPIITPVLNIIETVIDRAVPDKNKAMQLSHAIKTQILQLDNKALSAQLEVILAEAKGESWIQRSWRPILMLGITAIILNNYLLMPYVEFIVHAFGGNIKGLYIELPDSLFTMLQYGLGGYVVGRSAEKIYKTKKASQIMESTTRKINKQIESVKQVSVPLVEPKMDTLSSSGKLKVPPSKLDQGTSKSKDITQHQAKAIEDPRDNNIFFQED